MNWETRVFLALLNDGYSVRQMAKMLETGTRIVRAFWRRVLKANDKAIKDCLRHGIPVDCAAPLPNEKRYRCTGGHNTRFMPCVQCAAIAEAEMHPYRGCELDSGVKPKTPLEGTDAWPGTAEKIEVFRKRFEDGEALFHIDDVRFFR